MSFTKTVALELLTRAHEQQRLAHAYLICGPQGSGKRDLVAHLAALVASSSSIQYQASSISPPFAPLAVNLFNPKKSASCVKPGQGAPE